jgi:hypothetical protein
MGLVITWEGKPANVDGAAITPRIGVVVVPKRRRHFGRNTPLTFRDLFQTFPSREWANPRRSAIRDHLCHTQKQQLFENDIGGVHASPRKRHENLGLSVTELYSIYQRSWVRGSGMGSAGSHPHRVVMDVLHLCSRAEDRGR